jgi:hypothetical protein
VGLGGGTAKYFFILVDIYMLGVSEVVVSVLLLLITVLLAVTVVSTFFNVVYNPAQSQFVIESAKPLCTARVVAVANESRYAKIYVYNMGTSVCVFDRVYAIYGGAVVASGSIYLWVEPGQVNSATATLSYSSSWVYRLTGPRGEVVEGRP